MPSSVPDTCRINRALKGDWREWWRTEIPARTGGAGKGCVRRTRLEKKTVETSAARNVNKYKFNLEVHNNHLTSETIRNKQVSASVSVYLSRDFKRIFVTEMILITTE